MILGALIIFAGFVLFTATVRVQAFRQSTKTGLFTFVIPLYGWWYGFTRYRSKLRLPLMFTVLACYLVGGIVDATTFYKSMKGGLTLAVATEHVHHIIQGARSYVENMSYEPNRCALPPSTGPAPRQNTCCGGLGGPDADSDGRCDVSPERWRGAWANLRFEIVEPTPCVYELTSYREGEGGSVIVEARCDLDCDGQVATVRRSFRVTDDCYIEDANVVETILEP